MTLKDKYPNLPNMLFSSLAGLVTAYAIAASRYQTELTSMFDWVVTLILVALGTGFIFYKSLPYIWDRFIKASLPARYWAILLAVLSTMFFSSAAGSLTIVTSLVVGFIFIAPGLPSLQNLVAQKRVFRFFLASVFSGVVSFFILGFLRNFHPSIWEFVLISIILNIVFTIFFDVVLEEFQARFNIRVIDTYISACVLILGFLLVIGSVRILLQYPAMFSADFFLPLPATIPYFIGLALLSQSWTAIIDQLMEERGWRSSSSVLWIKRNIPGVLLAFAITTSAFLFSTVFVSPLLGNLDNYFDTDSPLWVNFLADDPGQILPMRAVHPYAQIILRPPVWLVSLLLNGNKFYAALLLNSFAGGLCAFLTWAFFKRRTGNTAYALILSGFIGFSNSHLLLSSFLESYIFSAAVLIIATMLLEKENVNLASIVPVGLVTFGITVTNLIQTVITHLFTQRDIKNTVKYVFIVLALAVILSFAQNVIQPNNPPFFIPRNLGNEGVYRRDIIHVPISETLSRANVMARTFTLFSVVAPRPLILLEEIGCSFPCFNTIRFFRGKYQYASYIGFGSLLARSWFVLLLVSAAIYIWRVIRAPRSTSLQTALALNILFNYMLHMNYGDDPMLYSPDWTYALVFFFGLSYEKNASRNWLQILLLILLTALLLNNIGLFKTMLEAIEPFVL